jgi:hypothetical protein
MGALWSWVCHLLKITCWLLTAYYPKTDGTTKQINVEVEVYLCMFIDRLQGDWAFWSASAELALNN